jgi:hypothetical protein
MRPKSRVFCGDWSLLLLVKHTPGQPLSEAEHRQRREAARARWAAAGKTAALGAILGGIRGAVLTGASERAAAEAAGVRGVRQAYVARQQEAARRADKLQQVRQFYEEQIRQAPAAERRPTLQEAIESLRYPERHGRPPPRQPARVSPIVGNVENQLIYARQLWQAQRRLVLARRRLEAVIQTNLAAGDDREAAEAAPNARRVRVDVASIEREIEDLERFQRLGSRVQARAEHTRTPTRRRGRPIPTPKPQRVEAGAVRQHRGGETTEALQERIRTERAATRRTMEERLAQHAAKTERLVSAAERRTIEEMAEAVRQNLLSGRYASQILRRSGRGALIGGVAGLTTAGVAILAHHVATAGRRKSQEKSAAEKVEVSTQEALLKARRPPRDTPEGQMGPDLAAVYRRWIDRLLGRGDDPVNLGDGMVEALGPGITEAYAQGLTKPPITEPEHPDYQIDVDFDLLNPAQLRHIAEYALDRIVEMTDAQREAIRDALREQAVLQGIGPKEVARTIKEAIGLTSYQRGVVASFRRQLDELDPRALERQLRDKRYDRTLNRAIETNTPLSAEQIDVMTDAYHRKAVALRAVTIARTESIRATSYGGLARVQQILDDYPSLDVTKRWMATHDDRTRDTHRELDGREVEGIQTPFVVPSTGETIRWPLEDGAPAALVINCRCTLQWILKPKRGQLQAVAV